AVNAAERRRVPRTLSVLALYAVIAATMAGLGFWLFPVIRQEFAALVAQGPAIASYFQDLADREHVVSVLGIPIDLRQAYNDSVHNLPGLLAGQLSSVVQNVFMLVNWIFQTILVLLVAFFLVKDAPAIRRFFEELVPHGYRTDAGDLAPDIYRMLGAYMRGPIATCAPLGLVTAVAIWAAASGASLLFRCRRPCAFSSSSLTNAPTPERAAGPVVGLLSVVHRRMEALAAVLGAVPSVPRVLVLGGIVGYGPDPNPVV